MSYSPENINYNRAAFGNYMSDYAGRAGMGIQGIAGIGIKSCEQGFSWTKLIFVLVVICTIAFISLQIQKKKYDKKYSYALISLLALTLAHGLIIMKLPNTKDPKVKIIMKSIKAFITFSIFLSFLVLAILMGEDKW